jgi:hypothetical protein
VIHPFSVTSYTARGILEHFSNLPIPCPVRLDDTEVLGPGYDQFVGVGRRFLPSTGLENTAKDLRKLMTRNLKPRQWGVRLLHEVTIQCEGTAGAPGLVSSFPPDTFELKSEAVVCSIELPHKTADETQKPFLFDPQNYRPSSPGGPPLNGGEYRFDGIVGIVQNFFPLVWGIETAPGDVYGAYCVIRARNLFELTPWIFYDPHARLNYCAQSFTYSLLPEIAWTPTGEPLPPGGVSFEGASSPGGGWLLTSLDDRDGAETRMSCDVGVAAINPPGTGSGWFRVPLYGDVFGDLTHEHLELAIMSDYFAGPDL